MKNYAKYHLDSSVKILIKITSFKIPTVWWLKKLLCFNRYYGILVRKCLLLPKWLSISNPESGLLGKLWLSGEDSLKRTSVVYCWLSGASSTNESSNWSKFKFLMLCFIFCWAFKKMSKLSGRPGHADLYRLKSGRKRLRNSYGKRWAQTVRRRET